MAFFLCRRLVVNWHVVYCGIYLRRCAIATRCHDLCMDIGGLCLESPCWSLPRILFTNPVAFCMRLAGQLGNRLGTIIHGARYGCTSKFVDVGPWIWIRSTAYIMNNHPLLLAL
jgi:hypothetical protein